jgi:hypothetical protein
VSGVEAVLSKGVSGLLRQVGKARSETP